MSFVAAEVITVRPFEKEQLKDGAHTADAASNENTISPVAALPLSYQITVPGVPH